MKNTRIKIDNPEQFREIQRIAFNKGIYWCNSRESKIKTSNILYIIDDKLSWETSELSHSIYHEYEVIKADDFIRENTQFPLYKIHKDSLYVVQFSDLRTGEVIWVSSKCEGFKVGDSNSSWTSFYKDSWKDISEKTLSLISFVRTTDNIKQNVEIEPGTIVQATRKSTSENHEDYIWQGIYYGKFNEHYLLDFNGTSYRIAEEVQIIPTLTKKEAKQKISELFSNPKNVTSEKVRNIIDLIKI